MTRPLPRLKVMSFSAGLAFAALSRAVQRFARGQARMQSTCLAEDLSSGVPTGAKMVAGERRVDLHSCGNHRY